VRDRDTGLCCIVGRTASLTPLRTVNDYVDSSSRLAHLGITNKFIPFAERARAAVHAHLTPEGLLEKVCDIFDERTWRESSAEGQAFVVLLEAASRDYEKSLGK
jgi:hypothetical protein